jgi:hypothetical protein
LARGSKIQPQAEIPGHGSVPSFSPYQPHWTGLKAVISIILLITVVKLKLPFAAAYTY